jgi:hypothetical protein
MKKCVRIGPTRFKDEEDWPCTCKKKFKEWNKGPKVLLKSKNHTTLVETLNPIWTLVANIPGINILGISSVFYFVAKFCNFTKKNNWEKLGKAFSSIVFLLKNPQNFVTFAKSKKLNQNPLLLNMGALLRYGTKKMHIGHIKKYKNCQFVCYVWCLCDINNQILCYFHELIKLWISSKL